MHVVHCNLHFRIDLLYKWKERNGHDATYHQLAKSLFEAGAIDSVHTLCQELGAPHNPRVRPITAPPLAKRKPFLKTSVSSDSIQGNYISVTQRCTIASVEHCLHGNDYTVKFLLQLS